MMNIAIRRTGVYSPFSVDLAGNYDIDIARLFFCIAEGGGTTTERLPVLENSMKILIKPKWCMSFIKCWVVQAFQAA